MGGYRGMSGYWNQYDNCFGCGQLTTQQKNCKNDFVLSLCLNPYLENLSIYENHSYFLLMIGNKCGS